MHPLMKRGLAALLGICALAGTVRAAGVEDIVRDTQRLTVEDGSVSMIWWIPVQFWEASMRDNADLPEAARTEIIGFMAEYNVVALLRAKAGPEGLEDIRPKDELVKNTRVEANGKVLEPLAADKVSPAALVLLSQLKPVIAAAAGQVGEAMEFVVYPAFVDGKAIIDATQPGALNVTFYGRTQQWRLPLGSLLPPKIDKVTGEQFPGNYEYNPYTGKKIEVAQ